MPEFPHLCSIGGEHLVNDLFEDENILAHDLTVESLRELKKKKKKKKKNSPSPEILISAVASCPLSIENGLHCSGESNAQ
jgi:hypothetical protein